MRCIVAVGGVCRAPLNVFARGAFDWSRWSGSVLIWIANGCDHAADAETRGSQSASGCAGAGGTGS
jgi:hypothetical protein